MNQQLNGVDKSQELKAAVLMREHQRDNLLRLFAQDQARVRAEQERLRKLVKQAPYLFAAFLIALLGSFYLSLRFFERIWS